MSAPDVSVAIPTRDRPALLEATVRTVLAQEDVDLEVVIVDDGSDPARARRACRRPRGGRVHVLRNESSRGVAAARNQGAEAARAPWVAFLDDDVWATGKLAAQLAAARIAARDWAYTGVVKFAAGPVVWQVMPPPEPDAMAARLADKNIVPAGASNVLVRRATFLELGGFDAAELRHLADWDMWLRLLAHGLPAAAPGIAVGYRLHPEAMSRSPEGILTELAIIDRRWRHLRGGRGLDPGPTHLWIAMSLLRGDQRAAAASYLRAARTLPRAGLRGLLRTAHPRPPRPAHAVVGARGGPARRRVQAFELPDDMMAVLDQLGQEPS